MFLKNFIILLVLSISSSGVFAQIDLSKPKKAFQELPKEPVRLPYLIINGDTVPTVNLREITISDERTFKTEREARKWSRLKRDVSKVYPYAKIAGKKLEHYNKLMENMTEKEQKVMFKKVEKEIKQEFEKDIRSFTLNQGRVLLKLIDRETGNTSYTLVKDLRGNFQAFFWQSIARFFSVDLKSDYDPLNNSEDKLIEEIVISIENGTFVN